ASASPATVIRPGYQVNDMKLNRDGSRLLTITMRTQPERQTTLLGQTWATFDGRTVSPLFAADDSITSATLSAMGDRMLTITGTVVQVWDARPGKVLCLLQHPTTVTLAVQN